MADPVVNKKAKHTLPTPRSHILDPMVSAERACTHVGRLSPVFSTPDSISYMNDQRGSVTDAYLFIHFFNLQQQQQQQ
jgi:hypothetical protein